MEEKRKPFKFKGISPFVILFLLMTLFSSLFIGKIASASIEYNYENPYHFEKVIAVFEHIKKVESVSNWNDYYIRYAVYEDEETGLKYGAQIPGEFYNKEEAESYIGKTT